MRICCARHAFRNSKYGDDFVGDVENKSEHDKIKIKPNTSSILIVEGTHDMDFMRRF